MFIRFLFIVAYGIFCTYPLLGMQERPDKRQRGDEEFQQNTPLHHHSEINLFQHPDNPFIFRIGFEFQLTGDLFPHYKENKLFQKKSLFSVHFTNKKHSNSKPLWHVEIDGSNIEFVTKPFSYHEKEDLEICLKSIEKAFESLHGFVMKNRDHNQTSFSEWVAELQFIIGKNFSDKLEIVWTEKNADITKELYMVCPIKLQQNWQARFQPQATLQHPLEYTIPIAFALLGFDDRWTMSHLLGGLPDYNVASEDILKDFNSFNQNVKKNDLVNFYKNKMHGLSFLHALTLGAMTIAEPELLEEYNEQVSHDRVAQERSPEEHENACFLFIISKKLEQSNQVDPKDRITLMSRRPFSSMYSDITKIEGKIDYPTFFTEHVQNGNVYFSDFLQVPKVFSKTNYAEQFFGDNGLPRDLSDLSAHFQKDFYLKNKLVIDELLKKGVVSTTMIRNLKLENAPDFNIYYEWAIKTVEKPHDSYLSLFVGHDGTPLAHWNTGLECDMLSPPWFLDKENSMGGYTKDEEYDIKEYGEAIIEYRGINDAGSFFISKAGMQGMMEGRFLTEPTQIESQGIKLFDFLIEFGKDNNIFNEVNMGLIYSLMKQKIKETKNWQ